MRTIFCKSVCLSICVYWWALELGCVAVAVKHFERAPEQERIRELRRKQTKKQDEWSNGRKVKRMVGTKWQQWLLVPPVLVNDRFTQRKRRRVQDDEHGPRILKKKQEYYKSNIKNNQKMMFIMLTCALLTRGGLSDCIRDGMFMNTETGSDWKNKYRILLSPTYMNE